MVDLGTDLTTTAMACVDVLFTEEELATGNITRSRVFQQLDEFKINFFKLQLKRKFDSPIFNDQWSHIIVKINTKCRGKRRTLIQRLKKQTQF